jgi:glycosyltransferase involved in cell wall biosynthesis
MSRPFFSIASISYNQAAFLNETINSVLSQSFSDYEYIVQDPGSTDASRKIISSYSQRLIPSFEPDEGPADGLNRAFARATGRYYLFLNSDDILLPGSLEKFYRWISHECHQYDVFSGACSVVDSSGEHLRYAYSDKMNLRMAAYGQSILIQPSTVVSAQAFKAVGGFNVNNCSNWDGELFIDIALKGYRFARSFAVFSCYRIHPSSITGSGFLEEKHK